MNARAEGSSGKGRYFESPEDAVRIVSDLLRRRDFATLASYYELSGCDLDRADLESGRFFLRAERPEVTHPGESWRYRHPFPPGWSFEGTQPTRREGVVVVRVGTTIEQGADSPVQSGHAFFCMVQSANGWQILPEVVDDDGGAERPSLA